jgi:predicted RecA/RadA family phage recombinase
MISEYMADREFQAKATAVTGCKSGELIVAGALTGVAAYDAAADDPVEVTLPGVWELPKASGQINEGAAVWFDNTTGHPSSMPALQGCSPSVSPCKLPAPMTRHVVSVYPAFQ